MSNQISFAIKQPIIDALYDLEELKAQVIQLAQTMGSLADLMKDEHFSTQEAVREELLQTQFTVNGILQGINETIWDNSIPQMPEGMSQFKANELVNLRRAELRNMQLEQKA